MLDGDLRYTCFVATALKGRIKESYEDSLVLLFGDEARGDGEDVRIVMLTCELCQLDIPAESSTYLGVLVHDH